jgi:hypothetical protein
MTLSFSPLRSSLKAVGQNGRRVPAMNRNEAERHPNNVWCCEGFRNAVTGL